MFRQKIKMSKLQKKKKKNPVDPVYLAFIPVQQPGAGDSYCGAWQQTPVLQNARRSWWHDELWNAFLLRWQVLLCKRTCINVVRTTKTRF
jgi:hypothetical protein